MNTIGRKQSKRFMFYNLVTFTVIFSLFAFIIYSQISRSLFSPIQREIEKVKNYGLTDSSFVLEQLEFRPFDKEGPRKNSPKEKHDELSSIPIRIHSIVRSTKGDVLNKDALGRLYWDNLLEEIPFDSTQLESYNTITLASGDIFQSYSFAIHANGEDYYVQLLANISGEQAIIDNLTNYLLLGILVSVTLSIGASYYLSSRSMAPLLKSWERQSEFVENTSHELRTPLTIIQNKLENLFAFPHSTILENSPDIGVALSETRRLSKLTSDLMTLARADSNMSTLQKEYFDLDLLIRYVGEPYIELAEMQEKTMLLDLRCTSLLYADKSRIHELMVILLDNALKYTGQKSTITIATSSRDKNIILQVIDTGIGFSTVDKDRIFQRFYRGDKSRSRETGGSGLGLSIAQWIVQQHQGNISITSNKSQDTVVEVVFPVSSGKHAKQLEDV